MKPKVGLALGAGGARGLAHLGVLKVLEKNDIPIDFIAGTSMGAIVGAMYAQEPDADLLIARIEEYLEHKDYEDLGLEKVVPEKDENPGFLSQFASSIGKRIVLNFAISKSSILNQKTLSSAIENLVQPGEIEDTKIPFCAVSTDLNTGQSEIMDSGNIRNAVQVSSSIPGFFPPCREDGKLLVDGGVTAPVPVDEAKAGNSDIIIGVSVGKRNFKPLEEVKLLDIMSRVQHIKGGYLGKEQLKNADIMLEPDIGSGHWSEFLRYKEFIQLGVNKTQENINGIKKCVKRNKSIIRRVWQCIKGIFNQ